MFVQHVEVVEDWDSWCWNLSTSSSVSADAGQLGDVQDFFAGKRHRVTIVPRKRVWGD